MLFLNTELSDWKECRARYDPVPNLYRFAAPWPEGGGHDFSIGFIRKTANLTIEEQTWNFDCTGIVHFHEISKLFYQLWNSTPYNRPLKWKDLEQAKYQVDLLIEKVHRIKAFL